MRIITCLKHDHSKIFISNIDGITRSAATWPVNSYTYALPYDRFPAGALTEVLIGAAYN